MFGKNNGVVPKLFNLNPEFMFLAEQKILKQLTHLNLILNSNSLKHSLFNDFTV